jgi:hypothetical protein
MITKSVLQQILEGILHRKEEDKYTQAQKLRKESH